MCQKQCRDANGMKCHLASESHLRNMKLFAQNSGKIIGQNSRAVLLLGGFVIYSSKEALSVFYELGIRTSVFSLIQCMRYS